MAWWEILILLFLAGGAAALQVSLQWGHHALHRLRPVCKERQVRVSRRQAGEKAGILCFFLLTNPRKRV